MTPYTMAASYDEVTVPWLGYDAETITQAATLDDARQRLQDLLAYLRRLRCTGSHEAGRLREDPATVLASLARYVGDVLDLIECAAGESEYCEHGFSSSCPAGCN